MLKSLFTIFYANFFSFCLLDKRNKFSCIGQVLASHPHWSISLFPGQRLQWWLPIFQLPIYYKSQQHLSTASQLLPLLQKHRCYISGIQSSRQWICTIFLLISGLILATIPTHHFGLRCNDALLGSIQLSFTFNSVSLLARRSLTCGLFLCFSIRNLRFPAFRATF